MTGEYLKSYLLLLDESLSNIARKIEVTPQHLNQTLSSKDIKTGFLEKVAKAYNIKISFFFDEEKDTEIITAIGKTSVAGKQVSHVHIGDDNSEVLLERVKQLEERIKEKDERIADLKERIDELKQK